MIENIVWQIASQVSPYVRMVNPIAQTLHSPHVVHQQCLIHMMDIKQVFLLVGREQTINARFLCFKKLPYWQ